MKKLLLLLPLFILSCRDATKEVFVNYNQSANQIFKLTNYFSSICPNNLSIYIKFNSKTNIDFELDQKNYYNKSSWVKSAIFDKYGQFQQLKKKLGNEKLLQGLQLIQFNKQKLDSLYLLLENAHCNSISNYKTVPLETKSPLISLGFPTNDFYSLDYIIFENNLDSKRIDTLISNCSFKKINNKVFVQYRGPAFGGDCFPDKR
jgi:hypothetical protein